MTATDNIRERLDDLSAALVAEAKREVNHGWRSMESARAGERVLVSTGTARLDDILATDAPRREP